MAEGWQKRFVCSQQEMVNTTALEFMSERLWIQPPAPAMADKTLLRLRLLSTEEACALNAALSWVLELQHDHFMLLRKKLEGLHGIRIMRIAEDKEEALVFKRGNQLTNP